MDWCYFQIIASVLLIVNYDLCMVHKSSCMLFRAVGITTKLLTVFAFLPNTVRYIGLHYSSFQGIEMIYFAKVIVCAGST